MNPNLLTQKSDHSLIAGGRTLPAQFQLFSDSILLVELTLIQFCSSNSRYTDAHTTLLTHKTLSPFQRFTLDLGDFVMHPDLVGQLTDGETIFAIEAKGSDDLIKGLAQAEMYQTGLYCPVAQ